MNTFGLNNSVALSANDRHLAFDRDMHLYQNLQEEGFHFQFTCNNDERVFYDGYFLKQTITYSNRHSQEIHGLQMYYNIDLMNCDKLSRDYKNITKNDIQNIIDQLMPLCVKKINEGILNKDKIIFNVNML